MMEACWQERRFSRELRVGKVSKGKPGGASVLQVEKDSSRFLEASSAINISCKQLGVKGLDY